MTKTIRLTTVLLAALPCTQLSAMDTDLWELSLEQLTTIQVQVASVATGSSTPVSHSASSVSVITREQIQAMGATDIDQVLETVPGLHLTRSTNGYFNKYIFRGITSEFNPEALLLINGIPVKRLFTGSRSHIWGGMPVKAIKRIEILRGPGSAVYGADAFSGVINILTLDSTDMEGQQAGLRAGSFDTWGGWVQGKADFDTLSMGLTLEYEDTNGQRETVYSDQQTIFDQLTGTRASLAPGPVDTGWRGADMRFDLTGEQWQWRAGYQWRDNLGSGVGVFQALDPNGLYRSDRINSDLTYHRNNIADQWDVEAQLSYYHATQENTRPLGVLPKGANLGGGVFTDGMLGTPGYKEDQARLDLKGANTGLDTHLIRFGAGLFWGDLYEITESKNFSGITPLPALVDVSDTPEAYLTEEQRTAHYLFLQDEWQINPSTVLSSGVRFDHYSDFGDHITPRIALVHEWAPTLSSRFSYGEAFHAPSFTDLYAVNNPVNKGNPNLKPETLKTWEAALTHYPTHHFQYTLTLFTYHIVDGITYVNTYAENVGRRTGKGGELEAQWQPSPRLNVVANYSHQRATDKLTNEPVGQAPEQEAYLRAIWDAGQQWQTTAEVLWVGKQPRSAGDPRPDLQDYTAFNLTLRRQHLWQELDVMLSARNLFDTNIREPSPNTNIPGDYPQAGRALIAEASWNW